MSQFASAQDPHPSEGDARSEPPRTDTFEDAVLCHFDLVFRLARRLTGNTHEAEDLVQETFLRAHRAYGRFELREYGAKPWLLKILHHAWFARRRRESRGPGMHNHPNLELAVAATESPEAALGDNVELDWDSFDQELKTALDALPAEYRGVMLLWGLGDLTYREIADVLECPIGTVMSRLHRARQSLAESLGGYARKRRFGGATGESNVGDET